jgi:hypothetical protein
MKTEFISETLVMKSLVEDSVLNGARRERRLKNVSKNFTNTTQTK